MKKLLMLVGIAALAGLCSCAMDKAPSTQAAGKVGVLWFQQSKVADNVYAGFAERMKQRAPNIEIEVKAALKDQAAAAKVYQEFQASKDAVVFLRSAGGQYMAAHPPKVPGFIGATDNPAMLGVVKNMAAPEGNITGVTYYVPAEQQFDAFRKMFHNFKSVGLLLKKGHPSVPIDQAGTKAACKKYGVEYHEALCSDTKQLKAAVEGLRDKVDLFILGNQNLLTDNSAVVAQNAGDVPIMSYAEEPILERHAVGGLVANDKKLGRMLADSVLDVIAFGKKVSEVPVKTDPKPQMAICMPLAVKHSAGLPPLMLKDARIIR